MIDSTPAPWAWIKDTGYPETRLLNTEDGTEILSIYQSHGGGQIPTDANALVIAMAPAMLECLRNVQANLTGKDYRAERIADALRRVNEMLAEIEGSK